MPKIKPREGIKKRFIQAVEYISKDNYPQVLQAGIIKKIGMAPSNFYTMRSGSASYPTLDQCYNLCNQFSISAEWLITGQGEIRKIDMQTAGVAQLLRAALNQLKVDAAQTKAQTKTNKK